MAYLVIIASILILNCFVRFSSDVLRGNKSDEDDRQKIKIKPLRETNEGVAQT